MFYNCGCFVLSICACQFVIFCYVQDSFFVLVAQCLRAVIPGKCVMYVVKSVCKCPLNVPSCFVFFLLCCVSFVCV